MLTTALYPGTFDPITTGHVDIIQRASRLFPQLVVAIAENRTKSTLFTLSQRQQMVSAAIHDLPNVSVCTFDTLLVELAKQQQATIIVRGLRVISDFEYELQMVNANQVLSPALETVFLPPTPDTCYISSSLVREIIQYGGDITAFVPDSVTTLLKQIK